MDVDFDVFCPAEDVFVCGRPGQPEAFLSVYLSHNRHRFVVDSCCSAVEFFACLTQVSWYGEFVGSYHTSGHFSTPCANCNTVELQQPLTIPLKEDSLRGWGSVNQSENVYPRWISYHLLQILRDELLQIVVPCYPDEERKRVVVSRNAPENQEKKTTC
ncbi:MAG: hypothetical protein PWQ21_634 [Thermotoga sp.]|jgi:hypothetical protein|nr:hypothetical protein [Thermotoga sp.]